MFVKTISILGIFAAIWGAPALAAAVTVAVSDRDGNDWDLQSSDETLANAADCLSDVDYEFTVTLEATDATSGRYLYLYEGSSCNDTPEACHLIGDAQSTADLVFEVPASMLFADGCAAATSAAVWVGLLESENQSEEDGGIWSAAALSITLDVDGPSTAPTGLHATVGSGNVKIGWDELSDADVNGFVLVYWDGSGSGDADADADAGPDAGGDTEPTDTGADEECSVAGGPAAGVAYDPALVSGLDDSQKDVAGATSATIDGLDNGTQYKFAVVALDAAANPSAFSAPICATPEKTIDFCDIYDAAGGKCGGDFCFVATAAFGSYDHPTVRVLRRFRDEFLVELPGGRAAVAAYYAVGPALAAALDGHESARAAVAGGLTAGAGVAVGLLSLGPTRFAIGLVACILAGLAIGIALPRPRRDA